MPILPLGAPPARRYVPVVRATRSVLAGLGDVDAPIQAALRPLFELTPPDLHPITREPRQGLRQHVARRWGEMTAAWRDPAPPFVDLGLLEQIEEGGVRAAAAAELEWMLAAAAAAGRPMIPVTSPGRAAAHDAVVRAAVQRDALGLCLRLPAPRARRDPGACAADVAAALRFFGVRPGDVDLVLDEPKINRRLLSATQARHWLQALAALPTPGAWRTVTLLGTAKPAGLSAVRDLRLAPGARVATARVPRTEWSSWLAVRAAVARAATAAAGVDYRAVPARTPAFGDYGIGYPGYHPVDPRVVKSVAHIWYTAPGEWLVYRGRRLAEPPGRAQYRRLARDLVAQPEYQGAAYSVGDFYIDEVAQRRIHPPGGPGAWRQAGTSHHLTQTVRQLATLPPGP